MEISWRPRVECDLPFLMELYASSRQDLLHLPLSDEHKISLIEQQFWARQNHYQETFGSDDYIVLGNEQPIGRLYLYQNSAEMRIVDIAITAELRSMGIGTRVIRDAQSKAAAVGLPLRLRVEILSPAAQLYTRLGFCEIAKDDLYLEMEWTELTQTD